MVSHQIEEYLAAIDRLEERGERVTTSSLARERGVAPPSVTEMLGRLAERGLVSYKPRGEIVLTERGRTTARSVVRRHRLWERFLHDVLGLQWDRVHGEAHRLEHATSPEVERELAKAVGDTPTCPHGHTIPTPDGESRSEPTRSLLELAPSQSARVVSVRENDPSLLRRLAKMGIKPGAVLEVREADPGDGYLGQVGLQVGETSCAVPREVAQGIAVAELEPPGDAVVVPLDRLTSGETGIVRHLRAGKGFLARCLALGFTPGTPVTMVQNPRSGPLVVRVRDTRVALGRGEAQKIDVVRSIAPNADGD